MHLRIQMLPQYFSKSIHHLSQLAKPQFPLASPALRDIRLKLLQAIVDFFVLREQLQLFLESGHFPRENGEDVLLFDRVVDGKVVCEIVARLQERAQRHALRFLAGCARAVEEVPGLAEVVVLKRREELAASWPS
jgi:hypothetical protein